MLTLFARTFRCFSFGPCAIPPLTCQREVLSGVPGLSIPGDLVYHKDVAPPNSLTVEEKTKTKTKTNMQKTKNHSKKQESERRPSQAAAGRQADA